MKSDGTAVARGMAASTGDRWCREPTLHTPYSRKASPPTAEAGVDITLDPDADPFATRYYRANAADMGNREF